MDAAAVYSCSGIAIVFLLDSFSVLMPYITECDGPKHSASTQACTTHSHPITHKPASQPGKHMKVMVQLGKRVKII